MTNEQFTDGPLTLELDERPAEITLTWRGRSIAREPAQFLLPILTRVIESGERNG